MTTERRSSYAIKAKHDGSVASHIYAGAAGGRGRRQADDAARLAQLQASAPGRGGAFRRR